MTTIDLDFSGVEPAKPYEPVETGQYTLIIESAKIQDSKKADGFPQLALGFVISGEDNKKVMHWQSLSPNSKAFILQFFLSLWTDVPKGIDLNTESGRNEFCAALIGMTCEAIVVKAKRQDIADRWTNKVDNFLPV